MEQRDERRRNLTYAAATGAGIAGVVAGCAQPSESLNARVKSYQNPFEGELLKGGYEAVTPDFNTFPGQSYYTNGETLVVVARGPISSSESRSRTFADSRARGGISAALNSQTATNIEVTSTTITRASRTVSASMLYGSAPVRRVKQMKGIVNGRKALLNEIYSKLQIPLSRLPEARQKYFREQISYEGSSPQGSLEKSVKTIETVGVPEQTKMGDVENSPAKTASAGVVLALVYALLKKAI